MPRRHQRIMPSAVYGSKQVADLANCGENQIPDLVNAGVLPAPLGRQAQGKRRRWSRVNI